MSDQTIEEYFAEDKTKFFDTCIKLINKNSKIEIEIITEFSQEIGKYANIDIFEDIWKTSDDSIGFSQYCADFRDVETFYNDMESLLLPKIAGQIEITFDILDGDLPDDFDILTCESYSMIIKRIPKSELKNHEEVLSFDENYHFVEH